MRKSAIITAIVLLGAAIVLAQLGRKPPAYTTSSREAYELYVKGETAIESFQWPQAQKYLERAIDLDSSFAMARASYAVLLRVTGHLEEAKKTAAVADSLASLLPTENERLLVQLRMAQMKLPKGANRDSLVAILHERLPDHPIVLSTEALIAMEKQEGDKAEELWKRLVKVEPNSARAYNWLGYNAAYMGRYDEAINYLNKYAFVAPDLANPHDSLGEILTYIGRYDEAEKEFLQALAIQEDFYHSLIHLGQVYIAQGRLHKGVDLLRQVGEKLAGTEFAKGTQAYIIDAYYENHMMTPLKEAVQSYVAKFPDDHNACFYRSFMLAGRGELSQAQALVDSILTVLHDDPAMQAAGDLAEQNLTRLRYSTQATFAEITDQPQVAAENWALALANSDGLPPHRKIELNLHYAEALAKLGRYDEVLTQVQQVLAVNPNVITALVLQSEAYLARQKLPEAQQSLVRLEQALSLAESDFPAVAQLDSLKRAFTSATSS